MTQPVAEVKAVSEKADKIFSKSDPVVRDYFTYGKTIREKSVLLKFLKKDLKFDEEISKANDYQIGLNDHERLGWKRDEINTFEQSPSHYIVMDRYRDRFMDSDDLKRAKKGVAKLRSKRRNQLYKSLSQNLDETELRTLKNALLPAKAPRGQQVLYNDVRKKLGMNKRYHKHND